MSFEIYHDVFIEGSAEHVYRCIAEPEELVNWWPLTCSGQPVVGSKYNFYFTDEYDWFGTVTKANPPLSLHTKMSDSDSDWNPTSFGFDIEKLDAGVMLHFVHSGWKVRNHAFRRTSFCWALLLNGLKEYVEKGIVIPFEERA